MAAGKAREDEHAFDEVPTAIESSANLVRNDTISGEPSHSPFERSKLREVVHQDNDTADGLRGYEAYGDGAWAADLACGPGSSSSRSG